MKYKGYTITKEKDHVRVIGPDGKDWTENTITDAKESIDEELEETETE